MGGTLGARILCEQHSRQSMVRGRSRGGGYLGGEDDVGPHVVLLLHQAGQKADGLDGLAQAHLIRQNAIHVVVVQGHQELEPAQLVVPQGSPHKHGWGLNLNRNLQHWGEISQGEQ